MPPLREQVGGVGIRGPVEDHAERSPGVVEPDEHDGALEVRVVQDRCGDEEAAGGELLHTVIFPADGL